MMKKPYCSYGSRSGLRDMELRDFIQEYAIELENYYGVDFGEDNHNRSEFGYFDGGEHPCIICLVDEDDRPFSTVNKPVLRKGGKKRRQKIKHRYSYENPMNRIHGFVFVENGNNNLTPEDKNILSLSMICSSTFTDKKGIGSDMLDLLLKHSKEVGFTDIVLEVANEFSGKGHESDDEEEEQAEQSDDDEDDQSEEDDQSDDEEEEWLPDEEALEIISHELWRKTMRFKDDSPYYNVEKEYISHHVEEYFYYQDYEEEEEKQPNDVHEEPDDNEYGGLWYRKGYKSQEGLIGFYKKFGFVDEPKVNLEWSCYSEIPFPSMICSL